MIKRIKVQQLRVGMFIHALDCDWFKHPFLRSKRRVNSKKIIKKLLDSGIREVYIDTGRGLDVAETLEKRGLVQDHHPEHAPAKGDGRVIAELDDRHREPIVASIETEPPPGSDVAQAQVEMKVAQAVGAQSAPLMGPETGITKAVSVKEEIIKAIEIQREVKQVTQELMQDVRVGKLIAEESLKRVVERILDSILRNQDALLTLGTIRDIDEHTYKHSMSVCTMMIMFCSSLNLGRDCVKQVGVGALLHDIGKARIPPEILNKTTMLTKEEDKKLKEHVAYGCEILSQAPWITPISMSVVAEHHEHYDGTGYPKKLKGEEISLYGQVAAIVNMYDILTSDQWYRKGMEPTAALARLLEWGRFRFSEELVHRFIRRIGIYPVGTLVRLDNGLLGVVLEQGRCDLLHPVVRVVYDMKKGWHIKPRDIDLSKAEKGEGDLKIVCAELPEKWKIDPKKVMSESLEASSIPSRLRGWTLG